MTKILIVDDEIRFRELYCKILRAQGFIVKEASNSQEALNIIQQENMDMVISDVKMPGETGISLLQKARTHPSSQNIPFLLVTAYSNVRDAVKALKLGAVDYLSKPIDLDELVFAVRETLHIPQQDSLNSTLLTTEILSGIVAQAPIMESLFLDAYRIASSDVTVLITGESGVGKEVFADFIHRHSKRGKRPFVAVNCGSLPHSLICSELFGHEKGAFTGAEQKRLGYFQKAKNGTLFLDEIGELPLHLQPTLLRVLETQQITPLGSSATEHINFRLIAATNRDLATDVQKGDFRKDLYYRLNVIHLTIPSLKDRNADILPLARHFLNSFERPKRLSRAAAQLIKNYNWPGNIRELSNIIARAHLFSRTDIILPEHLPSQIQNHLQASQKEEFQINQHKRNNIQTLENVEIQTIRSALEQTGGNKTKAAKILGITRRGLLYKLKRLGL